LKINYEIIQVRFYLNHVVLKKEDNMFVVNHKTTTLKIRNIDFAFQEKT